MSSFGKATYLPWGRGWGPDVREGRKRGLTHRGRALLGLALLGAIARLEQGFVSIPSKVL
jgi:hypothetical protein